VVGLVDALDAHPRVLEAQALPVDRLVLGHDAGEGSETGSNARARRVVALVERLDEHLGVELPGLAVDVEIGAREMRAKKGRAEMRRAREQFVDVGILGLADREMVEPRHPEEALGIVSAGMGGVENEGGCQPPRADRLKSGLVPVVGPHVTRPLPAGGKSARPAHLHPQSAIAPADCPAG
jgi:hypothetical protein